MLVTDTYTLTYETKSEDIYENFYGDKDLFDLSHYPKDSKFFDHVNERVIGKMKDVFQGKIKEVLERKINEEFGGLNSKM